MIKAIVEQHDGHHEIGTELDKAPTCRTPHRYALRRASSVIRRSHAGSSTRARTRPPRPASLLSGGAKVGYDVVRIPGLVGGV